MNLLHSIALTSCVLLMNCWPFVPASSGPTQAICSLYQSQYPLEFTGESLKPFLADFKASTAVYDAVLIEIKGGRELFYKRLSLDANGTAIFYELTEKGKLEVRKRPYSSRLTKLFEKVGSGHFSSIYQDYASEPSSDILLVKKAGITQFSYGLDRGCFAHLIEADKSKIADALPLVTYLKTL